MAKRLCDAVNSEDEAKDRSLETTMETLKLFTRSVIFSFSFLSLAFPPSDNSCWYLHENSNIITLSSVLSYRRHTAISQALTNVLATIIASVLFVITYYIISAVFVRFYS